MESKFESLLKGLSNHELAIYLGYQYESVLPYSKELIKKEIASRNLTKKQLEEFLNTRLPNQDSIEHEHCERCGSNKLFKDVDTEYGNGEYTTHVYEVKTNRCRLCYLNPSKDPPKNIFKRIKWYLFDMNKSKTITYIKTMDWFDD